MEFSKLPDKIKEHYIGRIVYNARRSTTRTGEIRYHIYSVHRRDTWTYFCGEWTYTWTALKKKPLPPGEYMVRVEDVRVYKKRIKTTLKIKDNK